MNNINWGIIGCGNVTEVKSGPAFNKVAGSALVAVMRRDAEKAKDYAERHGVPTWYADAAALINDPAVNAIYVATPPKYHEEYAIAALKAGKPVYVEKPMSLDTASCARMQQVASETQIKLCVAHYRRALPKFLKVKELLDSTLIGDIRSVRISMIQPDKSSIIADSETNWRVDPAIAGAGLFYDLAPHQLDLVLFYFGEALQCYGLSANQAGSYKAEDMVTGVIRLSNNVLFNGQWCFSAYPSSYEDIFEIIGSKGKISFPIFDHSLTIVIDRKEEVLNFEPPENIQYPMIEKVTAYFAGNGPNPCSAEDAIGSMKIMENFVYG